LGVLRLVVRTPLRPPELESGDTLASGLGMRGTLVVGESLDVGNSDTTGNEG